MFIHTINLKFQCLITFTQHRKISYPSFYVNCIASFVKKRPKTILCVASCLSMIIQKVQPTIFKKKVDLNQERNSSSNS